MKIKCVLFIMSLWVAVSFTQTHIKNSVIGSGATASSNGSFLLQGTAGQAAIGLTQSSNNQIHSGFWSQAIHLVTSVEKLQNEIVPTEFKLHQNYPNPFNPTTTIQFDVPEQTLVTLKIYNILGEEIDTLLDEDMVPGVYKLQVEAADLPTGIYFYRIKADKFVQTKKLMLVK